MIDGVRRDQSENVPKDASCLANVLHDSAADAKFEHTTTTLMRDFSHQKVSADKISKSEFLMSSIAPVTKPEQGHVDDSVIRRVSMAGIASMDVAASTRTTPRRPPSSNSYYLCPSNTFVASNGEVYHVEPFQLPPPSDIASLFSEKATRPNLKENKPPSSGFTAGSPATKRQSIQSPSSRHPPLPAEWLQPPPPRAVNITDISTDDSTGPDESDEDMFVFSRFSWKKFLLAEVLGIGNPGHLEPDAADHVDNFLSVPLQLERLIFFGFFVALDSFLYAISYLPLRLVLAILVLLDETWGWLYSWHPLAILTSPGKGTASPGRRKIFDFATTRQYDLMRGLLLLIGCYVLSLVNMSRVYHYIRMQNTIKVYVLTAMMEVIDKLLCSFGIDALDSLFWKTRARSGMLSIAFSFVVTAVYVVLHSGLYFLHLATLTVAINNVDQSLSTVLILNNFAEIKSFVLKKFDTENLFQLACADITERFKMCLFYGLIITVGIIQSSHRAQAVRELSKVLVAMICCEVIVDWIKHAFIAKFNKISASCYQDYSRILRCDIFDGHKDKITLDHSYSITKRLGMSPIPLACVFFRFVLIAYTSSGMHTVVSQLTSLQVVLGGLAIGAVMIAVKVVVGVCLIYYVGHKNNRERKKEIERKKKEAKTIQIEKRMMERTHSIEKLSNIERYTLLKGFVES